MSLLACNACFADVPDLTTALQNTYRACVGIDENMHELKVLAGVNTAVTAVGTGLGIGAVATGLAKDAIDEEIEQLLTEIWYVSAEYDGPEATEDEKLAWYQDLHERLQQKKWSSDEDSDSDLLGAESEEDQKMAELAIKEKKSKNLGNWRTGLLAGNTVTNVAGAIIASKTINKDDINGQIDACISATKKLNNAINAARMDGIEVGEAQQIYNACREYEFVDIKPIDKRGKGAMISASIGAGVGGVGTITSGIANSDKIRNDDTESGKQKEKDLNTASNVLAAGATVASATATIFNATQIAAIKKVAVVAQKCTEVLK